MGMGTELDKSIWKKSMFDEELKECYEKETKTNSNRPE